MKDDPLDLTDLTNVQLRMKMLGYAKTARDTTQEVVNLIDEDDTALVDVYIQWAQTCLEVTEAYAKEIVSRYGN